MSVDELIQAVKNLSAEERKEFHAWYQAFLAARRRQAQPEQTDAVPKKQHTSI
jgi:hypothetical protein